VKWCAAHKFRVDSLADKLACIAPWPDPPLKDARQYTANWHFVDIPVNASDPDHPVPDNYDQARDCRMDDNRGDCAILALRRLRQILGDIKPLTNRDGDDLRPYLESAGARTEALRFIVHIVGDLPSAISLRQ
jgi:hypothetical protein